MKRLYIKAIAVLLTALCCASGLHAQTKIGGTPGAANADALLQLGDSVTNKGLLLPRVALTAANAATPLSAHVAGMTVYNTATAGSAPNNVAPGLYYNNGTQWVRIPSSSGWLQTGNAGTDSTLNFLGTTDNKSLMFRVNNTRSGIISTPSTFWNTGFGYQALQSIVTTTSSSFSSQSNAAIGSGALAAYNTSGNGNNVAIGYNTLNVTLSAANVAIGSYAQAYYKGPGGAGGWNTSVGYRSLAGNPVNTTLNTGTNNVAFGASALTANESGIYNIAIGPNALIANKSGNSNTAIGGDSIGNAITSGMNNILIGGASTIIINPLSGTDSSQMNIGNALFGAGINGPAGGTSGKIGVNTLSPRATLDVQGSMAGSLTVTAINPYTVTATDYTVVLTTASASVILPAANTAKGRILIVRTAAPDNLNLVLASSTDSIYDRSGGTPFTGSGTFTLTSAGPAGLKLVSDGSSNWYAIP